MIPICDRLREERLRVGLTQQDLADVGGVSKNTQSNFEVGRNLPIADYLVRIASAGLDVSYVLLGVRSLRIGNESPYSIELFNALLDDYSELPDEMRLQVNAQCTALLHAAIKTGRARHVKLRTADSVVASPIGPAWAAAEVNEPHKTGVPRRRLRKSRPSDKSKEA